MPPSVLRLSCSEHSVTYLLPGRAVILLVCQENFFTTDSFLFLQSPCRTVSHRTCFGEGRPALLLGSLVRKAWQCLGGHWVLPRVRPGPCASHGLCSILSALAHPTCAWCTCSFLSLEQHPPPMPPATMSPSCSVRLKGSHLLPRASPLLEVISPAPHPRAPLWAPPLSVVSSSLFPWELPEDLSHCPGGAECWQVLLWGSAAPQAGLASPPTHSRPG